MTPIIRGPNGRNRKVNSQAPRTSLADDVAATKRTLVAQYEAETEDLL